MPPHYHQLTHQNGQSVELYHTAEDPLRHNGGRIFHHVCHYRHHTHQQTHVTLAAWKGGWRRDGGSGRWVEEVGEGWRKWERDG